MAAIVEIRVSYGSTETVEAADAADLNLLNADVGSGQNPTNYPIPIPSEGSNYSFERWFRAYVADMGGSSVVKNFRVYADTDAPIPGTILRYGQAAAYQAPVNTASTIATANIPTTEPAENLYIGGTAGGEITAAGSYTDYGVLQLEVPSTASLAGGTANITVMWDEIA